MTLRLMRRCGERIPRPGSAAPSGMGMRLRGRPSWAHGASGSKPRLRLPPAGAEPSRAAKNWSELCTAVLGDGVND